MPQTFSTRSVLLGLSIGVLAPVLVFSAALLWRLSILERAWHEDKALEAANRIAVTLDREVSAIQVALEALATSPLARGTEVAAYAEQVAEVAALMHANIGVYGPQGGLILRTSLPQVPSIPDVAGLAAARRACETRELFVSDLLRAPGEPPQGDRYLVLIAVPVHNRGAVDTVFVVAADVRRFNQMLFEQNVDPDWTLTLVDAHGRVVARTHKPLQFIGKPVRPRVNALADGDQGAWEGRSLEGTPVIGSYSRSRLTGMRAMVGVPAEDFRRPLMHSLFALAAFGALMLGLSIYLALRLGALLAVPLRRLATAGAALVRDEPLPKIRSRVTEIRRLSESLQRAAQELRHSEARLGLALTGGRLGWWEVDVLERRADVSDEFKRILEWPEKKPFTYRDLVDAIHPEHYRGLARAVRGSLRHGTNFDFELLVRRADGTPCWVHAVGRPLTDEAGGLQLLAGVCLDITERKRNVEHLSLMVHELNHRVKNTMASVQSIVMQSLRSATSLEQAGQGMTARLVALARAHDVLTRENWESAELLELVREAVAAYADSAGRRIRVQGPSVRLSPRAALSLSMALHELGTNAAKYGALVAASGHVDIGWTIIESPQGPRLRFRWRERGGPRVTVPQRTGFGSRLVETALARELEGTAKILFEPAGVECEIDVPLSAIRARDA